MKKYLSILLAALLCLTLALTACTPATEDPTKSDAKEETKSDATQSDAEEEPEEPVDENAPVLVDMNDPVAVKAAREKVLAMQSEIKNFELIRRDYFQLPCNKQFYDAMQASIDAMKALTDQYPDVLYTAESYDKVYTMEGTWQDIRVTKKGSVGAGWVKDLGWYMQNITMYQGDWYMAVTRESNPEAFTFEILDQTLADMKTAGTEIDADVVQAFKDVCIDLVCVGSSLEGYTGAACWSVSTTDVESRVIEQIYYDILGNGINEDNTVNNNEMCIEQGRKPYKDVSTEDMKASLVMMSEKYTALAEKYTALAPYAAKFAAYVEQWNGVQ